MAKAVSKTMETGGRTWFEMLSCGICLAVISARRNKLSEDDIMKLIRMAFAAMDADEAKKEKAD